MRKQATIAGLVLVLSGAAAAQTTVTNGNNGTTNAVPVYTGTATLGNSPITVSGSNVGIGTTGPQASLDVAGTQIQISDPSQALSNYSYIKTGAYTFNTQKMTLGTTYGYGVPVDALTIFDGNVGIGTTAPNAKLDSAATSGNNAIQITNSSVNKGWVFYPVTNGSNTDIRVYENLGGDRMTFQSGGNVGIGTAAPGTKLEVNGSVKLTANSGASITFADGTTQSTAFTGVLCGGDYAESIDVTGDRSRYEPGDVLVIDSNVSGKFLKSAEPYSTAVTGIYSTKPGTVGRRQVTPKRADEVPMAMIGIVPTKVSTENGSIHRGDLLVSSSTIGYAMKGTDRSRLTGAVIGKALDNLESGKGVIDVVVTLQ